MPAVCVAALLLLAGCGSNASTEGERAVGEARALDRAAEMLDEQRLPRETPAATPASDAE